MMYIDNIIKGSPNGLFQIWYIWPDLWRKSGKILKNGFRSLGRESKIKHFPFKFWHLKCSFSLFSKITFLSNFQKIMFCHFFLCLASVLSRVYNDVLIFDNVIRITLKVPLIGMHLSQGSCNGKNRLLEGYSRFL